MISLRAARRDPPPLLRRALADRHHRRRRSACTTTPCAARSTAIAASTPVRRSAPAPWIRTRRSSRATLEQYPRLRATRLWAMLRDRGYPGSAVQVRRYVRTVRPAARAEAFFRLDTLAGRAGPGRLGQLRRDPDRPRRGASCRASSSCSRWSRAVYARFALDQTLESFLRGHVEAFAALGRRARATLLYDNLKSVVLERLGRAHPLPPAPARARRPLPLRPAAVRRRPRQ